MKSELRIDGRVIEIESPFPKERCFNPGMIDIWGKTLLIYRVCRTPSRLAASILNVDCTLGETRLLSGLSSPTLIPKDPRLVALPNGRLGVWFAGHVHRLDTGMFYAELDERLWVRELLRLDYADPMEYLLNPYALAGVRCQRNWVPLDGEGRSLCIYNHDPLTVLERNGVDMRMIHHGPPIRWEYGAVRGGTPLLWHDDRWYSFFHSSRFEPDIEGVLVKVYYVGCYTLSADFSLLGMTPEPIMGGHVDRWNIPWEDGQRVAAVFPCGAVPRGDSWLLSYGWMDSEIRLTEIPMAAVEERLRPVGAQRNTKG